MSKRRNQIMTGIRNMRARQTKRGCLCGALLLWGCLSAAGGAAENIPAIPAPSLYPDTALVANGRAECAIVYPAAAPDYARAARELAAGMQARYGAAIPLLTDEKLCPRQLAPILPEYRRRNLILLGNVRNHRALLPLYAGFWCGADGAYPGGDGFEVRTVCNPWGTGKNAIVLGASSPAGAAAAVAALMEILPAMAAGRALLPHLLVVQPGGAVKPILDGLVAKAAGYEIDYDRLIASMHAEPVDSFATMAFRYHWTGDRRWAEIARKIMLCIDEHYNLKYYAVSHYRFERFFRAWDIMEETGIFTEAELHGISRRLVETAFRAPGCQLSAPQRSGGGRHHTARWMSAFIAADYILRNFPDAPELRETAGQWRRAADATFKFAVTGGRDAADRYSSQDTAEMFMRWSLLTGCRDYFDSGMARQGFLFFLNYFNPLGFACGLADYQEGAPEAMYDASHGLRYQGNLLGYVYDDPRFAWLREHDAVCRRGQTYFGPNVMAPDNEGHFEPEPAVAAPAETPAYLLGMTALPLDQRSYSLHFPEPGPRVAFGQAADKVYFRSGFAPDDQYLVLQCLQSRNGANCIPQYVDKGQIWLFHNTDERGTFYRNGVFVSDGVNPPASNGIFACRADNLARFSGLEISRTTLLEYMGADWTRTIIRRPRAWFLVMDHVTPLAADDYTVMCSWRLLHHAEWRDDCRLVARAGGAEFHLKCAAPVTASAEQWEQLESSACPFFLRQTRAGAFPAGRPVDFQNLLYVRGPGEDADFTPVRVDEWTVLIKSAGQGESLAGIGTGGTNALGLAADPGCVYVITPDRIYLSNCKYLSIKSAAVYAAATAQTVEIDLQTGAGWSGADTAELFASARTWELSPPRAVPDSLKMDPSRAAALCREVLAAPGVPAAYADYGAKRMDVPAQTAAGFKIIAANPDACRVARKITGVAFHSAGIEGQAAIAADGIKEPVARGRLAWPAGVRPELQLRLPTSQALDKMLVYFYGRIPGLSAPARPPVQIEAGADGRAAGRREFDAPWEYFPVYKISSKGKATALSCLSVDLNGIASSNLLVKLPFNVPASYLSLKEVELYSPEKTGAMIDLASAADLEGDGRLEIIAVYKNEAGAGVLKVFAEDGRELWRKMARGAFSCAAAGDVNGDGREEIMAASEDYRVWLWAADGTLIWEKNLESLSAQSGKKHWPNGSAPTGVGLWTPAPDKKFIIVGGYCHFSLLDADGNVRDNCTIDGRYVRAILQKQPDLRGDGRRAAFLLQQVNNSGPGDANIIQMDAAGKLSAFSYGALIPDGRFAADLTDETPPRLSVIGPRGFGFYKTDTSLRGRARYSLPEWRQVFTRPISAGALADMNGDRKLDFAVGGSDGFISVLNRDDGRLLNRRALGRPVCDMLSLTAGGGARLVVAADADLRGYDRDLREIAAAPLTCLKLVPLRADQGRFAAFMRDGALQIIELE